MGEPRIYQFTSEYDPGIAHLTVTLPFDAPEAVVNVASTSVDRFLDILTPYADCYSYPSDGEVDKWVGTLQHCLQNRDSIWVQNATSAQLDQLNVEIQHLKPYSLAVSQLRQAVTAQQRPAEESSADSRQPALTEVQAHQAFVKTIALSGAERAVFKPLAKSPEVLRAELERAYASLAVRLSGAEPIAITPEVDEATHDAHRHFSDLLFHYNSHGLIIPAEKLSWGEREALPEDVKTARKQREQTFIAEAEKERRSIVARFFGIFATDRQAALMAGLVGGNGFVTNNRKTISA